MKKSLLVVSSHRLSYFILQYLLKQHHVVYRSYQQFNDAPVGEFLSFNTILISEPTASDILEKIKHIKSIHPGIKIIATSSDASKQLKQSKVIDKILKPMVNIKNLGFLV